MRSVLIFIVGTVIPAICSLSSAEVDPDAPLATLLWHLLLPIGGGAVAVAAYLARSPLDPPASDGKTQANAGNLRAERQPDDPGYPPEGV